MGRWRLIVPDPSTSRRSPVRRLLGAVLDWCAGRDVEAVEVGTQIRNLAALRLYQRAGFMPVGAVVAARKSLSP